MTPRHVLLFSGHRVDAPGRTPPRFTAAQVPQAAAAIAVALDALQAGAADIAFTQGAAGGDLLFAEACLARGVRLQLLLPLPEPEFIAQSVLPATDGDDWRHRYLAVKHALAAPPRVLPGEPGPVPPQRGVFERCNEWLLATALAFGGDKLRFICLWDGGTGDGPGSTAAMVRQATRHTRNVTWLDTRRFGVDPVP